MEAEMEISEYDRTRPPLKVPDEELEKLLDLDTVEEDLRCPICLDVFMETNTVMACLHRFCKECITDAIRRTRKECPACRIPLRSKRDLRPDYAIDAIVRALYGDIRKHREKQVSIVATTNQRYFADMAMRAQTQKVLAAAQLRAEEARAHEHAGSSTSATSAAHAPSRKGRKPSPPVAPVSATVASSVVPDAHSSPAASLASSSAASKTQPKSSKEKRKPMEDIDAEIEEDDPWKNAPPEIQFYLLPHPKEKLLPAMYRPRIYAPSEVTAKTVCQLIEKVCESLVISTQIRLFYREFNTYHSLSANNHIFDYTRKSPNQPINIYYRTFTNFVD